MKTRAKRLLPGEKVGRLTIVGLPVMLDEKHAACLCRCECGAEKMIRRSGLLSGIVVSCGCYGKEQRRKAVTVHGCASPSAPHRRLYSVWAEMRGRCRNPKSKQYKDYGGRGIKVCQRWEKFENFFADMGECPSGLTLDRVDNDGDYEPSNCRWADRVTQQRNSRRLIHVVELGGQKLYLREVGERLGIPHARIGKRMYKKGCTAQEAVDYYAARG